MKKVLVAVMGLAFILGATSTVNASKCEFYQWKWSRCKGTPVAKSVPAPKEENLVLKGVKFDTASSKIKKESFPILDSNVDKLKNRKCSITVVGYTDNRGSEKSNMKLSQARADSVKAYFVSKGIAADRLNSIGKGPADPVADNNTEAGRAENRRIELQIR